MYVGGSALYINLLPVHCIFIYVVVFFCPMLCNRESYIEIKKIHTDKVIRDELIRQKHYIQKLA